MGEIPDFHYTQAIFDFYRKIGMYYDYKLHKFVKNENYN